MLHQPILPSGTRTKVTSLKRKSDRETLLSEIKIILSPFGIETRITPCSDRHFCAVFSNSLIAADVDFDARDTSPPMINWHKAARPLKAVPNGWEEGMINRHHRRKTTSFPQDFSQLLLILFNGFAAAADGTAFLENAPPAI